jgi:hypothetical protein
MEFFQGRMGSVASLSPGIDSRGDVTTPAGRQGLHSRFNPKLVGFGIVNAFEPSSAMPADLSQDAALPTSYATKPTEILK